jgi:hypothetical protein
MIFSTISFRITKNQIVRLLFKNMGCCAWQCTDFTKIKFWNLFNLYIREENVEYMVLFRMPYLLYVLAKF